MQQNSLFSLSILLPISLVNFLFLSKQVVTKQVEGKVRFLEKKKGVTKVALTVITGCSHVYSRIYFLQLYLFGIIFLFGV